MMKRQPEPCSVLHSSSAAPVQPTQVHTRYVSVSTTRAALNTEVLFFKNNICWKLINTSKRVFFLFFFKKLFQRELLKFFSPNKWSNLLLLPLPASHLPFPASSQKKSVGPLTTGTAMCNYSMTPGCPFSNPTPPFAVCVSSLGAHNHDTHTPR